MIDVLIVDDSALMRRFLTQIFEEAGGYTLRTARNGEAALAQMSQCMPDVVTLDINMPEMDGLTCLSHIMVRHPCPVIMVSSLTEKGALATLEALELGAVDYLTKPGGTVSHNIAQVKDELLSKVQAAVSSRPRQADRSANRRGTVAARAPVSRDMSAQPAAEGLVLVGVSTGGPSALETLLGDLPADLKWPLVVTQHMPATFTSVLAERLDGLCDLHVVEVGRPTPLQRGHVYLARGDRDLEIRMRGGKLTAVPVPASDDFAWHPSADRMVASALEVLGSRSLIGVLLTGMGDDGAETMARLHDQGGKTIAESEETTVVYGMPRALVERSGASEVLPLEQIAGRLKRWLHSI
ncbi:MAG: chemotaxis response regulator protein-glutamate methylesterase [Natronospirillum sp.]|uniref:protein-glutamate methylesterase/protein-glutamine glutaminase n=1 Tax=Natronospirillum sp. TaxID=2812955 RepID=UPI0025E79801|nr:chemotaxis response regulator protein-glutamate methylesterase [Natronospirillum sp.]MCH8550394.1 chemotaxis response regulator protein-glutamate methylesterase [Natronospirillum sp.]